MSQAYNQTLRAEQSRIEGGEAGGQREGVCGSVSPDGGGRWRGSGLVFERKHDSFIQPSTGRTQASESSMTGQQKLQQQQVQQQNNQQLNGQHGCDQEQQHQHHGQYQQQRHEEQLQQQNLHNLQQQIQPQMQIQQQQGHLQQNQIIQNDILNVKQQLLNSGLPAEQLLHQPQQEYHSQHLQQLDQQQHSHGHGQLLDTDEERRYRRRQRSADSDCYLDLGRKTKFCKRVKAL